MTLSSVVVAYEVETHTYSGPFDMLLHLILQDEVDLYEVSLVDIVDKYLAELDKMGKLELDFATEFLMIASTLIELKSRRLLPDPGGFDLDEELALWEERDLLLARLLECKTFKDAAQALENLARMASRSYSRRAGLEDQFIHLVPDPLENVSPADVRSACIKAMTPRPVERVRLDHVTAIRITVSDVVSELVADLPDRGVTTLRSLTSQLVERIEVVVYFLAVLELFKQGVIELGQEAAFGDISVTWLGGQPDTDFVSIDAYEG